MKQWVLYQHKNGEFSILWKDHNPKAPITTGLVMELGEIASDEDFRNATLMALAPELIECLEELVKELNRGGFMSRKVAAAEKILAKVSGGEK